MATNAKNREHHNEAELVVSATIRNHCRSDHRTGYLLHTLITERVDTCKRCGGVLINPCFSPEEECHLFVTQCAANLTVGDTMTAGSNGCSREVCRHCDKICGVPGVPNYQSSGEPFSDGDPATYCTEHQRLGISRRLKLWIEQRDHYGIMDHFLENVKKSGRSPTHDDTDTYDELAFRARVATAMTYEFLPRRDYLGLLINTELGNETIRIIYSFVSGKEAAKKCFDGHAKVGEELWPPPDKWKRGNAHIEDSVPPHQCMPTLGRGDFEAYEFFANLTAGIIRQTNEGWNEAGRQFLEIITTGVISMYFFERCECGRLLLPGQTDTSEIGHLLPKRNDHQFWPCGHTVTYKFPQIPQELQDKDFTRTRHFDQWRRQMHPEVREACYQYRREWIVQHRTRNKEQTQYYPELYLVPTVVKLRRQQPRGIWETHQNISKQIFI